MLVIIIKTTDPDNAIEDMHCPLGTFEAFHSKESVTIVNDYQFTGEILDWLRNHVLSRINHTISIRWDGFFSHGEVELFYPTNGLWILRITGEKTQKYVHYNSKESVQRSLEVYFYEQCPPFEEFLSGQGVFCIKNQMTYRVYER